MITSNCTEINQVLVEQNSGVRTIILNRPKQLNALSSQMPMAIPKIDLTDVAENREWGISFLEFEYETHACSIWIGVETISTWSIAILDGKGRVFCAGGDVAAVVRDIKEGRHSFLAFQMCNWKLGAKYFWKEFILNYVMATYNKPQVFAMPETALGLFPDVGALITYQDSLDSSVMPLTSSSA
ncbi:hypothetical protein LguiA_029142 [Lonicera macranthoides]